MPYTEKAQGPGGCLLFLTVVLITLKLSGVVDWSWWTVTTPLWVPALVAIGLFSIVAVLWVIGKLTFARDRSYRAVFDRGEEEIALGLLAPIAAELNIGRLTPAQAEKQIQEAASTAPAAPALWKSMSAEEREELALNFMRLAMNADFVTNVEEQLASLKEADPKLWEESMAKAKRR